MLILRTFIASSHETPIRLTEIRPCRARAREAHDKECLVELIDINSASDRLQIEPSILEAAAEHRMISHYRIAAQIRFDPHDLDEWIKTHRINEI